MACPQGVWQGHRIGLDADIHWRIVHVVLDPFAINHRQLDDVAFDFQAGGYIQSPTCRVSAEIEWVGEVSSHETRRTTPAARNQPHPFPKVTSPVKSGIGKRGCDVGQFDAVCVNTAVTACARSFDGEGHMGIALNRHPPELHVSVPHEARRSPILQRIGKYIGIRKDAPVLPGAELSDFSLGVPKANCRLPFVNTHAEEFPLKYGRKIAEVRWRARLHPKRDWRTPANVLWSSPNSPSNDGSLVTRRVSNHAGLIVLKS